MVIEKNTVVAISYSMSDAHNTIIESNDGYAPIVYLHGGGNILPELEVGLNGLKAGESKEIIVTNVVNHTYAGVETSPSEENSTRTDSLRFIVNVISIRHATPEEVASGFPLPESSCGCKPGCC
jgi:FKBP-type peptidyl-prolyl cis-trans isomerase 2